MASADSHINVTRTDGVHVVEFCDRKIAGPIFFFIRKLLWNMSPSVLLG